CDRDQRHCRHGMGPACLPEPDAAHKQELRGAGNACGYSGPKGEASRPEADPHPEGISRPPVEYVDAEGRDHERDRKMYHHHVDRMSDQGDRRADIEPVQLQEDLTLGRGSGIAFLRHGPCPPRRTFPLSRYCSVLRTLVQVGLAATLSGCSGPLSTLDPSGPAAASIATLWWVMLAGAAALFALVVVLFALVVLRPGWGS